jgi:hypothetical protein
MKTGGRTPQNPQNGPIGDGSAGIAGWNMARPVQKKGAMFGQELQPT